jgi:hypothetical protein
MCVLKFVTGAMSENLSPQVGYCELEWKTAQLNT